MYSSVTHVNGHINTKDMNWLHVTVIKLTCFNVHKGLLSWCTHEILIVRV